jgi:tricorn protease
MACLCQACGKSLSELWIYSLAKTRTQMLTGPDTDDFDPVFDLQGRYLYFLSNRDFGLTFSDWEFNYLYTQPTRVYIATLNPGIPSPFAPQNDQETLPDSDKNKKETKPDEPVQVDLQIEGFVYSASWRCPSLRALFAT